MKIVKEELFTLVQMPAIYIATTNSYIKRNGELVMGRGAAMDAVRAIPNVAIQCGDKVASVCGHLGKYGYITVRRPATNIAGFGIFQVKYSHLSLAELGLIKYSVGMLGTNARRNRHVLFRMNFPGIGNGKLEYDDVLPLLERLPDNVTVCTK